MILYKKSMAAGKKARPERSIDVLLEELPTRIAPTTFRTPKELVKYIKGCEGVIRKSLEYREYVKFLKKNLDMNRCIVLRNLVTENKKYRIEIHHEPFTLFDIVATVLNRRLALDMTTNALAIADEVMELHYEGKVGLIPLSLTMHELVHADRIFIPLQFIYQKYNEFFNEYKAYIDPVLLDKIEAKANLSLRTEDIVSDCLDVEFVYVNVDGFKFPEIPEKWKNALSMGAAPSAEIESTEASDNE